MTRSDFIEAYIDELRTRYVWAENQNKLDRFINSVTDTLDGANTWNFNGQAVNAAWHRIGGSGVPTLKKLRELKK